jgi:predicted nucleic acid-binding protein
MIIVDANVAIKWIIKQPLRDRALAVLTRSDILVAPTLFVSEMTSALWQYVRAGQIASEQARRGLVAALAQVALLEADAELAERALTVALELGYAPYDCLYLVAALRRNAPFVTADKRFVNRLAATSYGSRVVSLSDWT